jgi:hypothetical protein
MLLSQRESKSSFPSADDWPTQAEFERQEPAMGLFEAVAIGAFFAAGSVAVLLLTGVSET